MDRNGLGGRCGSGRFANYHDQPLLLWCILQHPSSTLWSPLPTHCSISRRNVTDPTAADVATFFRPFVIEQIDWIGEALAHGYVTTRSFAPGCKYFQPEWAVSRRSLSPNSYWGPPKDSRNLNLRYPLIVGSGLIAFRARDASSPT